MIRRLHTALAYVLALLAITTTPLHAQNLEPQVGDIIQGTFQPSDGDSFRVNGVKIRLLGVDAPEIHQTCKMDGNLVPCGVMARDALAHFVGNGKVTCQIVDIDRYKRRVAICSSDKGILNALMAEAGWVVPMTRYSHLFVPHAELAQKTQRGLWAMEFHNPADWRKGARW
jgi:endonuclease YncB( thermonuclease family)